MAASRSRAWVAWAWRSQCGDGAFVEGCSRGAGVHETAHLLVVRKPPRVREVKTGDTAGLRVDEIAHLARRDLRERGDAGQVTAYGKGGKTRVVLLPATVRREVVSIRDGAPPDDSKRSST